MVRAKLVKIGNARWLLLAKPLVKMAGLTDDVEIDATPGLLTIRPASHPRAGWGEAAAALKPELVIDGLTPTRFDQEEWSC